MTRSGRPVAAAIEVMDSDDVLVARIVDGGQIASSSREQPGFDVEALRDRLGDQTGSGEVGPVGREGDAAEHRVAIGLAQLAAFDRAAE